MLLWNLEAFQGSSCSRTRHILTNQQGYTEHSLGSHSEVTPTVYIAISPNL